MEQLQGDIDFLAKFTERLQMQQCVRLQGRFRRKIKKELDEYLARKRKEQ